MSIREVRLDDLRRLSGKGRDQQAMEVDEGYGRRCSAQYAWTWCGWRTCSAMPTAGWKNIMALRCSPRQPRSDDCIDQIDDRSHKNRKRRRDAAAWAIRPWETAVNGGHQATIRMLFVSQCDH